MDIRKTLIAIRESRGLSKKAVADMSGIPYTTYIKYESGERKDVSMLALCKLADLYGVSTDYLLGRPGAKPPESPIDEFAKAERLKDLEEIIIREYLTLEDSEREAVLEFIRNCIRQEEVTT